VCADHVGFPTLVRKFVTTSSNLSWTDLDAIGVFDGFDLHLAVGILGSDLQRHQRLFNQLAAGVLCPVTRKCISTLAAAEEAMGFTGLASMRRASGRLSAPGRSTLRSGLE